MNSDKGGALQHSSSDIVASLTPTKSPRFEHWAILSFTKHIFHVERAIISGYHFQKFNVAVLAEKYLNTTKTTTLRQSLEGGQHSKDSLIGPTPPRVRLICLKPSNIDHSAGALEKLLFLRRADISIDQDIYTYIWTCYVGEVREQCQWLLQYWIRRGNTNEVERGLKPVYSLHFVAVHVVLSLPLLAPSSWMCGCKRNGKEGDVFSITVSGLMS